MRPDGLLGSMQALDKYTAFYDPVAAYCMLHGGAGFEFEDVRCSVDPSSGEVVKMEEGDEGGDEEGSAGPVAFAVDFPGRADYISWVKAIVDREGLVG